MIQVVKFGTPDYRKALARLRNRFGAQVEEAAEHARERSMQVFGEPLGPLEAVRRILSDVRRMGDAAVALYTEKFDGCRLRPQEFRVPQSQIEASAGQVSAEWLRAAQAAKDNIYQYHRNLRERPPREIVQGDRALMARSAPLGSAGLYVPGGLAPYPSTVLMTAVPAQAAGVRQLVLCTPPRRDGGVAPEILAAAMSCGITEVYRVGGVQAIGALAYGTESIPRVAEIVGPGNLYVQLAKKEVFGVVGIDQFAGPSEILVVADETANAAWVAADMLSQAEHAPDASAILVTPQATLVEGVVAELEKQVVMLPRGAIARESLRRYGLAVIAESVDACIAVAEEIAPEHLELHVRDAASHASRITRAGAVFVGP